MGFLMYTSKKRPIYPIFDIYIKLIDTCEQQPVQQGVLI